MYPSPDFSMLSLREDYDVQEAALYQTRRHIINGEKGGSTDKMKVIVG